MAKVGLVGRRLFMAWVGPLALGQFFFLVEGQRMGDPAQWAALY